MKRLFFTSIIRILNKEPNVIKLRIINRMFVTRLLGKKHLKLTSKQRYFVRGWCKHKNGPRTRSTTHTKN